MFNLLTEYKYYTIRIRNQNKFDGDIENNRDRFKTYKLIYEILQLQEIIFPNNFDEKMIKDRIASLKNSGIKIIHRKCKNSKINKIDVKYYTVYAHVIKDSYYRKRAINNILNKEVFKKELGVINNNDFINKQIEKYIHVTKKDENENEYSKILDVLSSYMMCDNQLANSLDNKNDKKNMDFNKALKKLEKKRKKEIKYYNIKKITNKEYKKWKNKNKSQHQKWIKTKTYKINNIFYDLSEKEYIDWDWFNEKWIIHIEKDRFKVNGLINISIPYISCWAVVNTDNLFVFDKYKYQIDESVKQYKVGADNKCDMDKILCLKQNDNIYFFDMNINQLDNNLITELKGNHI